MNRRSIQGRYNTIYNKFLFHFFFIKIHPCSPSISTPFAISVIVVVDVAVFVVDTLLGSLLLLLVYYKQIIFALIFCIVRV